MNALILGNGVSRKGLEYRHKDIFVFGCNAAYRDTDIDALVCVDIAMQHEVYCTGYAKEKPCYFSEWSPIEAEWYQPIYSAFSMGKTTKPKVIENKPTDRFVMRGIDDSNSVIVTWLDKEDKVESIPDAELSSGSMALLIACEQGYDKIYMAGFDGVGHDNVYYGTPCYERSQPRAIWISEHESIYARYPNIEFVRVNCQMKESTSENVSYTKSI